MNTNRTNGAVVTVDNKPVISNLSSGKLPMRYCSRCDRAHPVEAFRGDKPYCIDSERTWRTDKIVPTKIYSFAEIERSIGGSRTTLQRWREDGRLICISGRPSFCSGQRLIEAIENRF